MDNHTTTGLLILTPSLFAPLSMADGGQEAIHNLATWQEAIHNLREEVQDKLQKNGVRQRLRLTLSAYLPDTSTRFKPLGATGRQQH